MKLWWIGQEQEGGYVEPSFEGVYSSRENAQAVLDENAKASWNLKLTIYETTLDEGE